MRACVVNVQCKRPALVSWLEGIYPDTGGHQIFPCFVKSTSTTLRSALERVRT
jgi:hypothetical protein